ncbi:hypothetical protein PanWU01x14_288170 [Parasponia andersonii]|uniref:Uncharacterized protein n=1 Tax=Parasponia andersonii TaxID=3476 RepID=A0A2P5AYL1_PARAD|nr:hypothetical protein PanWU01x14_288170 [Parasponia andersonii]
MSKIKERFQALDLMERAKKHLFKQFFEAPPLQFYRLLIHQFLLRKVEALADMKEVHFDISGKRVIFRLCEFALTTRLNFEKYPGEAKLKIISGSKRLIEKYMNDSKVKEKDFYGSILTSIHGPKVSYKTDELVRDRDELDANEEHLKESKATDEMTKSARIFLSHEPEVRDKNSELETLASTLKKLQADIDELKATQLEIKQN